MLSRGVLVAALLLGSEGCGTARTPDAPRYPARHGAAHAAATFTLDPSATVLSVPCGPRERDLDNGLDDDCDGVVDRGERAADTALLITLSTPSLVDVTLSMGSPSGAPVPAAERAHTCEAGAPFSLQTLSVPALPKGKHALTLARTTACGAELPAAVAVSIWLHGRHQGVYAVGVPARGSSVVGVLNAP